MIDRKIEKFIYTPSTSTKKVIQDLYRKKIDICLVCSKNKKLLGIITLGDIKKAIVSGSDPQSPIKNVMNTTYQWANKSLSEQKLRKLSKQPSGQRRIPILDENGKVIGLYPRIIINEPANQTVLITGGAGYIGSILSDKLLKKGYNVIILDKLSFGKNPIKNLLRKKNFQLIVGNINNINDLINSVKNADIIIHLAGIVGDPASAIDPSTTMAINHFSTKSLIELSKYYQVSRFIFASSCSVYGASDKKLIETSSLNPVSMYAKTKVSSENELLNMADNFFHPVILRFATLYGKSPRMRFDLAVNTMTAHAYFKKNIHVHGGKQWRPMLHVYDAAMSCIAVMEKPIQMVENQIFNVGSDTENYQIQDIAKAICAQLPTTNIIFHDNLADKRNYRVSFKKIKRLLNFKTNLSVKDGVKEIVQSFKKGQYKKYTNPKYNNYLHQKNNH